ncbi:amidohydrolase family protein [Paenibacillus sp. Soil724D2]|uniref:amidohydrolase family protein n=1 Tax=Paenibacillus sp. (strain Soil724D2) TaxID=1736392 RepID=UPI000B252C7D|nr:amidohydrolase family protein [Paenibacillus sp. Soil724D2]
MGQWLSNVHVNGGLHDIYLDQGIITQIVPGASDWEKITWDAQGMLMLPTFKDYHVHLDKAFPDQEWVSRRKVDSLFKQFQMEKDLLAPMKSGQKERARTILQQMLAFGTTRLRVHVDIDPEIGLTHLEMVRGLQEEFKSRMDIEIVAFPQQGLIRSQSVSLIKQALEEGASIVGGVDPAGVDRDIEACLNAIFELCVAYDAEADIHLHDPGHLGLFTLERIMDYTEQSSKSGKVAVSHAYCLGQVSEAESLAIAERLGALDIAIITSVPIDSAMPRVAQLTSQGVRVYVGSDHTGLDAWTPFGFTDQLARGRRMADMNRWNDDERLRSVYPYLGSTAAAFQIGDPADFILLDAINAEHAIAAAPPREIVSVRGVPVAGRQLERAWKIRSDSQE